jgi:hypothetical protein
MAKKDIIARILENNPDKGYSEEQLDKDYNTAELRNLERTLSAGNPENEERQDSDREDAEPTVDDNGIPKDLTEEEKTALEVQQASAEGEQVSKKFKLADPKTQYAEQNFTLQGDEEKELPENPSAELIQRIRSGFIKEV